LPLDIVDLVAEISARGAILGDKLNSETSASLAEVVRIMNCYYSNLIEGHNTLPRDAENALEGNFDDDPKKRNLQLEAASHIRLQRKIDDLAKNDQLPEPASREFIKWLHTQFYSSATEEMLTIKSSRRTIVMEPGQWRSLPEHDVTVGRHIPPSGNRVSDFMEYFERCYKFEKMGKSEQILAIASAHHRFNYIHPFLDGNGRVSRLMSHAMALKAGIGAHGLWSVSRGLARGIKSRKDYKSMMDHADMPRQGDLDGRGNLSQKALITYTKWFLEVCLDQIKFMSELFDLSNLETRLNRAVQVHRVLKPQAALLLQEALRRGEFARGDAMRITGLPETTARIVLRETIEAGLLASKTAKSAVSLRFNADNIDVLFPKLYPES
jgi:Fic family protein